MTGMFGQITQVALLLAALAPNSLAAEATEPGLVARWRFDEIQTAIDSPVEREPHRIDIPRPSPLIREEISGSRDSVHGFFKSVAGVRGKALRLGGISSYLERESLDSPFNRQAFSVDAWIALGAYPVNWCPVVAEADEDHGIVFGLDAHGRVGLQVAIDGAWHSVVSRDTIPLNRWTHVACSFDATGEMAVYANGQLTGAERSVGPVDQAKQAKVLIGKHPVARQPLGTLRPYATEKVHTYFDGILDDLRIYDRPLSAAEIATAFAEVRPAIAPELPKRNLPGSNVGNAGFAASYTTLPYYDAWDYESLVGDAADVVVQFDTSACKFVFWRGASYIPHWVTENGVWFNNEFVETWNDKGCHEAMSDKYCRYSNVRILESSPARAVVQWRYALADNWYSIFRADEPNDRGEWVEETYTIYPDAVGVRKIVLYSSDPLGAPHEWNEAIVVMGPGQRPEDVLEADAVSLANSAGESRVYSWRGGPPAPPKQPTDPNIEVVNTRSKYKPFSAFLTATKPVFDIYAGEQRPDISMFPWWNHWPAAVDPCDGRYAMAADRAAHSSLTHCTWNASEQTDRSVTKLMLHGVSDKPVADIARLVRSWDAPPNLEILTGGFESDGYDPSQRAYLLRASQTVADDVSLRISASDLSPLENVAVVISNWGERSATVKVEGKAIPARVGHRSSLSESDLVVWIELNATTPTRLRIKAD